jgi:hypothetical protein
MKASANKTEQAAPLGAWTPWAPRLPFLGSIVWVGALAVFVEQGRDLRGWLAMFVAIAIGLVAVRRTSRLARVMCWGVAVVVASLGPHGFHRGVEAWGAIGAMACAIAACVAIARIPDGGGMVLAASPTPVPAIGTIAALWWAAIVACFAPSDGALSWMAERPRECVWGAAATSLIVMLALTEWTLRRRFLELGVAERTMALRAGLATALVTMAVVTVFGPDERDGAGLVVVAASSALAAGAARHSDAVRVARITRRVVVLMIAAGGVASLGASVAAGVGAGAGAWGVTLVTAVVVMLIGAIAPALEGPLRPAGGLWLDAFARARIESSRAEPEDAIREALIALRAPARLASGSPELWMSESAHVTTVDRAGYVHDREGELAEGLIAAAVSEPEGTLRADLLGILEVRRPELRPLSKWMADRDAMLVTAVVSDGEAEGVLVLPFFGRQEPPTLEELRALKDVADRLAIACRAVAARTRMRSRAYEASQRAQRAEEELERGGHERVLEMGRNGLTAARLARPATVGVYGAASRMALEALERQTTLGGCITIVAPSGVDPVPYLARAHLAGSRADAPLVFVDGTSAREHESARWHSRVVSPLALADRGMLVLLDGAALPMDVQKAIARAVGERRGPWDSPGVLDVQLAFTAVVAPDELLRQARLHASLALRLAAACPSPIVLPRLRDRVDDLRALITGCLAREGLRVLGRPIGIDPAAYARFIEYPFPGDDAELAVIVRRLVPRCTGDVIRIADIDALRLTSPSQGSARTRPRSPRKSPLSA